MPSYPAKIAAGENGLVLVTFPDVPEAIVCAVGEQAALARAPEILDMVLLGYEAEQRPLPEPSLMPDAPRVTRRQFDVALLTSNLF